LAFISDVVGFYSTAGIIKNVKARPTLTINNFDNLNYKYSNPIHFIGKYDSKDKTDEKVCYYEFNIYDEYHNLYETSGRQIHNIEKNVNNYESQDEWTSSKKLQTGKNYSIEYKVITNNSIKQFKKSI
jgi:hypothetical protein